MDLGTAIETLTRLEHVLDELDSTGTRIAVDVDVTVAVRLEGLAALADFVDGDR